MRRPRGSWSRRLATVAVLALVGLSACRNSTDTTTVGTATSTTAGTGTTNLTSPTTVDPAQGALGRKDTPPEGVKEQLDFFAYYQGPEASCSELDGSRPAVFVSAPNAQVASTFALCFPGFTPKPAGGRRRAIA